MPASRRLPARADRSCARPPDSAPAARSALAALAFSASLAAAPAAAQAPAPRFEALVVAETRVNGGPEIHAPMVAAARPWIEALARDSGFAVTFVESPNAFTDAYLARFDLVVLLNYTPYRWNSTAQAAFRKFVDEDGGGYIGIHHALLYGPVVTPSSEKLWTWYGDFLGGINYRNYIASFCEGTVRLEAPEHPVMKGVPASFQVTTEEWYTFDRSPRPKVKVLANVDEASYKPASTIKMGDHPVVWTNEAHKGRNLFLFMGHHPNLYQNEAYKTLLRNAILWAGSGEAPARAWRPDLRRAAGGEALRLSADREALHVDFPGTGLLGVDILDAAGRRLARLAGQELARRGGRIDRTRWARGPVLVRAATAQEELSRWVDLP